MNLVDQTVATSTIDNLLASDTYPLRLENGTIAKAGVLKRGTVLGRITASGSLVIVNSANTDGSQTPYAVLAQDTDSTFVDVVAPIYTSGAFNRNSLIFGGTDTVATHEVAMRSVNLYLGAAR